MVEFYRNYLYERLDALVQTSSVDSYYNQFEAIRDFVSASYPWLSELNFTNRFIYGLRLDVQAYVIQFEPVTVLDAYYLACRYEYNLYPQYFPESRKKNCDLYLHQRDLVVPSIDKFLYTGVTQGFSSSNLVVEREVDSMFEDSSESVSNFGAGLAFSSMPMFAAESPTSMEVVESMHLDQSSIEISVVETHCAQSDDCVQSFLIPNDNSVNTGNTVSILQNLNVKFQAPAEVDSQGSNVDEDHELISDSFVAYGETVIDDITLMKQQTAGENVGAFLFDNGLVATSCSFESEHKGVLDIYVLRFFDYNIVSCLPEISLGSLKYPWCFDPGIIHIWLCRCEEMLFNVLGDISEFAKVREAKKYSTKIVSQGEEFAFLMKRFVCPEFHAVCDYGLTWKYCGAICDTKMQMLKLGVGVKRICTDQLNMLLLFLSGKKSVRQQGLSLPIKHRQSGSSARRKWYIGAVVFGISNVYQGSGIITEPTTDTDILVWYTVSATVPSNMVILTIVFDPCIFWCCILLQGNQSPTHYSSVQRKMSSMRDPLYTISNLCLDGLVRTVSVLFGVLFEICGLRNSVLLTITNFLEVVFTVLHRYYAFVWVKSETMLLLQLVYRTFMGVFLISVAAMTSIVCVSHSSIYLLLIAWPRRSSFMPNVSYRNSDNKGFLWLVAWSVSAASDSGGCIGSLHVDESDTPAAMRIEFMFFKILSSIDPLISIHMVTAIPSCSRTILWKCGITKYYCNMTVADGRKGFIKNMVIGTSQLEGVVIINDSTAGYFDAGIPKGSQTRVAWHISLQIKHYVGQFLSLALPCGSNNFLVPTRKSWRLLLYEFCESIDHALKMKVVSSMASLISCTYYFCTNLVIGIQSVKLQIVESFKSMSVLQMRTEETHKCKSLYDRDLGRGNGEWYQVLTESYAAKQMGLLQGSCKLHDYHFSVWYSHHFVLTDLQEVMVATHPRFTAIQQGVTCNAQYVKCVMPIQYFIPSSGSPNAALLWLIAWNAHGLHGSYHSGNESNKRYAPSGSVLITFCSSVEEVVVRKSHKWIFEESFTLQDARLFCPGNGSSVLELTAWYVPSSSGLHSIAITSVREDLMRRGSLERVVAIFHHLLKGSDFSIHVGLIPWHAHEDEQSISYICNTLVQVSLRLSPRYAENLVLSLLSIHILDPGVASFGWLIFILALLQECDWGLRSLQTQIFLAALSNELMSMLINCSKNWVMLVQYCFKPGIECSVVSGKAPTESIVRTMYFASHFRLVLLVLLKICSVCWLLRGGNWVYKYGEQHVTVRFFSVVLVLNSESEASYFFGAISGDNSSSDSHTSEIAQKEPGMKLCNYISTLSTTFSLLICLSILEALGRKSRSKGYSCIGSEVQIFFQGVVLASVCSAIFSVTSMKISEDVSYVGGQGITTVTSLFVAPILWRIAWYCLGKDIKQIGYTGLECLGSSLYCSGSFSLTQFQQSQVGSIQRARFGVEMVIKGGTLLLFLV